MNLICKVSREKELASRSLVGNERKGRLGMMFCQARFTISDGSQIGEVRREVNRLSPLAGLQETEAGKAAIVASELATNLSRYAEGGEILLRSYEIGRFAGVEILAIDRGPGMASVARCLEDGY